MRYLKIIFYTIFLILLVIQLDAQSIVNQGIKVGNKAPEIIENSVLGRPIRLSSLAGKIVLIDFWASWCRPCRNENPFVVSAYDKFKEGNFKGGKGFTIFSVSLDRDLNAWKNAIQSDHLKWETNVCAPSGKADYVQTYEIESIPSNFLVDGNGIILAVNLRGEALAQKLASLKK